MDSRVLDGIALRPNNVEFILAQCFASKHIPQHMRHVHRIYLEFFHIFQMCFICIAYSMSHIENMKNKEIFILLFSMYHHRWMILCTTIWGCMMRIRCHFVCARHFRKRTQNIKKKLERIFSITTFSDFDEFLINWIRHVLPKLKHKYIPPKFRRQYVIRTDSTIGKSPSLQPRKCNSRKSAERQIPRCQTPTDAETHFKWFNYMRAVSVRCLAQLCFVLQKGMFGRCFLNNRFNSWQQMLAFS